MVGGMQTSFSLVHAEHGQMLVVAESHFIFRLRQPLQALITAKGWISAQNDGVCAILLTF